MAVLNNEEIRETFNYLATIENIIQKEVKQVKGNKSYLDKIVPKILIRTFSQKEKTALTFSDNLSRISYEFSVVALVATFEKITFSKYRTSYGTIKTVVKNYAEKPLDYYKSRERFINENVDKLHLIVELIDGHIGNDLLKKLKIIKEQRDYIAHGKRFGEAPATDFSLQQIAETLDEIISAIEYY